MGCGVDFATGENNVIPVRGMYPYPGLFRALPEKVVEFKERAGLKVREDGKF